MAFGSMLAEEIDPAWERKERGAFFTPSGIARFIASQVIVSSDALVLEPSCGEAEFVVAAGERLRSLGVDPSQMARQLMACELHEDSIEAARLRIRGQRMDCSFVSGDFLRIEAQPRFDVVLGNPPYVRFQILDASQRAFHAEIARRLGVKLSALSSMWAPFVLHACEFLRPGGRLGMVLPAELLTVNYAAPIRSFLLGSFSKVSLFTFDRNVFPEVQEEVVLLIACGYQRGSSDSIAWHQCDSLQDLSACGALRYEPARRDARWNQGLVPDAVRGALNFLEERGLVEPLEAWGKIALGGVTGDNSYFALNPSRASMLGLSVARDCTPICPPGSRHMRRLSMGYDDWSSLGEFGASTLLFSPDGCLSKAAKRYIAAGERTGVDQRYKCRKRDPWWRVPLPAVPDLFISYMNSYGPNLCANEASVGYLNSCHGLVFEKNRRAVGMRYLPLAAFSSLTLLSAEMVGRSYGGGIQKLEPREAARLLVPSRDVVESAREHLESIWGDVDELLGARKFDDARVLVDQALLIDALGLSTNQLEAIGAARSALGERRRNRSRRD